MPNTVDVILFLILAAIIGAAVTYIIKAKKNGVKCIGCSAGGACHCTGQSGEASGCGCACACESQGNEGNKESHCCGCRAEE